MIKKISPGDKFSYLTTEQPGMEKVAKWKCKCFCGNYVVVRSSSLLSGKTQSCGCMSSAIRNDSFYSNRFEMLSYMKDIQKVLRDTLKCSCTDSSCNKCSLLNKSESVKKWLKKDK